MARGTAECRSHLLALLQPQQLRHNGVLVLLEMLHLVQERLVLTDLARMRRLSKKVRGQQMGQAAQGVQDNTASSVTVV